MAAEDAVRRYHLATFLFQNFYEQLSFHVNRYFWIIACLQVRWVEQPAHAYCLPIFRVQKRTTRPHSHFRPGHRNYFQTGICLLTTALPQLWSKITPVSPISTWVPLLTIFGLTAAKELFDDLKRRRGDKEFNSTEVRILSKGSAGGVRMVASEEIQVGDVIELRCDDPVPCDVVVLKTSDAKGLAFSMTANLDGETDLKVRRADKATQRLPREQICDLAGVVVCNTPNKDLHSFNSYLVTEPTAVDLFSLAAVTDKVPLSVEHTLWQGTSIKKVEWVLALAVYTGMETRVGMNTKPPEQKVTQADAMINKCSVVIFCIQLLVVLVFGITGSVLNLAGAGQDHYYLGWDVDLKAVEWVIIPLRFLLLESYMIPISMKFIVDVWNKMFHAQFINWDRDMYDETQDEKLRWAAANNTTLVEDMGQIAYVMTDKTGTLTQNVMEFKKCSSGGTSYVRGADAALQAAANNPAGPQVPLPFPHSSQHSKTLSVPARPPRPDALAPRRPSSSSPWR
jgi:magnesium-transporting ATPase (P-type)